MSQTIVSPKGIYRDLILPARGQETDRGWRPNLVVDPCRILLATLMRRQGTGIRFLLVGRGDESWDTDPEPPQRNIEALTDPSPFRVKLDPLDPDTFHYIDSEGEISSEPTPRLQVTVTLPPGDPPLAGEEESYPLREFALAGRIEGEDYLVDYVRHAVVHKRAGDTLVRTVRLVF